MPKVEDYIKGLFKSEKNRANCVGVAHSIGSQNNQRIHHLINDSPWDYKKVLQHQAVDVSVFFTHHPLLKEKETALLVDEVGFRKKGRHSVCSSRQYLGCIGKHDVGQVAVAVALSAGKHYCPIDIELFMPKSWEEDTERRGKTKIPDEIMHRTKPQMAWEMIQRLTAQGVDYDYVNFDALYGSNPELLHKMDKEGMPFLGDTRSDLTVFFKEPQYYIPENNKGKSGPKYRYSRTDEPTLSLRDYKGSLTKDDFHEIAVRESTKGELIARFHQKEVWLSVDKHNRESIKLTLLIRIDKDGTVRYSFSSSHDLNIEQLARRQAQRVFVEKVFEEGKNQIGMGDYQVRSWHGFHRHMTLSFMAFYYIFFQKLNFEQKNNMENIL